MAMSFTAKLNLRLFFLLVVIALLTSLSQRPAGYQPAA